MNRYELFSKRDKVIQYDVLEYDELPEKFRNQVFYIWKYALGFDYAARYESDLPNEIFETLRDALCREHGLLFLRPERNSAARECVSFMLNSDNTEMVLDMIELSIRFSDVFEELTPDVLQEFGVTSTHQQAVRELNERFRENGIGYEFIDGRLIRKDSEYLHEEAVKPALYLLQVERFDGALEEFLRSHDHFRKGNYKEAIIAASNAFESTMKTICAKRNWTVNGNGNASQLIKAIVENELIPGYLQTHVNSLKTTLEGLSTVRNKVAGHGQGENSLVVPEHFVNYALHLCGTNIVLLIEAYKDLPEEG